MNASEAHQLFGSIKRHFADPKYDALKYNFILNRKASVPRSDQWRYEKLAKKRNLKEFIIANFVESEPTWVGDILSDEAEANYKQWLRRQESLTYIIEQDLYKLQDNFLEVFRVKGGQHPELFKLVRRKEISLETFVCLNDLLDFFPAWDRKIQDTIIWPAFKNKCLKYQRFLQYDKKKVKSMVLELASHYK
jgi:hypothetical protein